MNEEYLYSFMLSSCWLLQLGTQWPFNLPNTIMVLSGFFFKIPLIFFNKSSSSTVTCLTQTEWGHSYPM